MHGAAVCSTVDTSWHATVCCWYCTQTRAAVRCRLCKQVQQKANHVETSLLDNESIFASDNFTTYQKCLLGNLMNSAGMAATSTAFLAAATAFEAPAYHPSRGSRSGSTEGGCHVQVESAWQRRHARHTKFDERSSSECKHSWLTVSYAAWCICWLSDAQRRIVFCHIQHCQSPGPLSHLAHDIVSCICH